ncbi:hypothetical protein SOASR030_22320 [Leminorella grimontii]|uniref:Uncharacterized protein n=1 Tax=Leminorella grimontii TaxID=82981 RepID=A0AAV5N3H7_9GAMM|nr:hypothetical protein SOASR030_22320 [Leminorella grimontii]
MNDKRQRHLYMADLPQAVAHDKTIQDGAYRRRRSADFQRGNGCLDAFTVKAAAG